MLPQNLWHPWEPRASFPVFADARVIVDFIAQDTLRPGLRSFVRPVRDLYLKRKKTRDVVRDYINLALNRPMRFRGVLVDREGRFLRQWQFPDAIHAGDFFSVDVTGLLEQEGLPAQDGVFILISSRGRPDLWNSSPGSTSVRYVGRNYVAGYRTGLFSRTLNPVGVKKHFGFTGLNPQVMVSDGLTASVLLINHSSDPLHDTPARPSIRLYRNPTEYLEADFGEIAPHGALERGVLELFPDAPEFLRQNGGRGYSVTRAVGVSLASIHILRSPDGRTVGMDHSRPAHTNLVDYL